MNTKILIHSSGNRKYKSLIKHLAKCVENKATCIIDNLHNKLFDSIYIHKPDIILFPIIEYTQEIHNYVETKDGTKIIFYVDVALQNKDLIKFLDQSSCLYICEPNHHQTFKNSLNIKSFYDDSLFYRMTELAKNNKVAVALSEDNDKNNTALKDILYPIETEYKIVLFNNPKFSHPQNIGIYNEADLNYILNTYSYFVDMDKEFTLETAIIGINVVDVDNVMENLKKQTYITYTDKIDHNTQCSELVKNIIIPYLGLS